jgi:Flp pilus assembly protein CpaB
VKRSNRLVILVGVLLAVLAFVGIVVVLNQGGGPSGNTPEETKVKVLVAKENIDIGDPVTPDKAEIQEVDPADAVQTRIGDPSLLTGRPAPVPIAKGAQITRELAGLIGTISDIESQLEPGEKAIAFQVDRVTGIDFLIQRGDRIDIVLAQNVTPVQQTQDSIDQQETNPSAQPRYEVVGGLNNVRTVKTIIQDRRVLYVSATRARTVQTGTATPTPGQANQQPAAQEIDSVIIVIAGTDQDAELIKFAQQDLNEVGQLTAVLRRIEDTDEGAPAEDTSGITLKQLIEQYGVLVPDIIVLQPEESASPTP